jgi:hypothetical protein
LLLVRIAVVVVAMVEIVSSAVETEDHAHRVEIEDRAHRVEIEGHVHRVEIEGHAHREIVHHVHRETGDHVHRGIVRRVRRGIVHHVHREIDRRVHRGIVHLVLSRHQQIQPHQLRGEQCSQLNSRLQHRNRPMLATRRASRGESKPCYWHRHEQSIADSIAVA